VSAFFRLFLCDAAFLNPLTVRSVFRTVGAPRLSSSGDFVYGISSDSESELGDDSDDANRSVKTGGETNWKGSAVLVSINTAEAMTDGGGSYNGQTESGSTCSLRPEERHQF
jgi:hypothetical protein